jgi:acyl dehydratase
MEAYLKVIPKRPPGNVHAGQKLAFAGKPVAVGARLRFDFSCVGREIRKERRWVSLGVQCTSAGQPVLEGQITTIWAK